MSNVDRRSLLYLFGIASISPLLSAQTAITGKVSVAKLGESRFAFSSPQQTWLTSCKLTSEDTAGSLTAF
jgi:hypothetical protein